MPTIALHSDLHLNMQSRRDDWLLKVPDILILAGDITRIDKVTMLLIELVDAHSELQILFVTGNHEYYDIADMIVAEEQLAASLADQPRIHFLQCRTVEIAGIRFLGCTGWSQMLALGIDKQRKVQMTVRHSINDFFLIGMGDRRFTPDDCIQLGKRHYDWLDAELSLPSDKKTIVITHFSPSLKVAHPLYPIDEITAYFCSTYDALIKNHKPEIWAFGHTHANFDINMGSTRVVSNQHGYGQECKDSYQPNMFILI